MQGDEELILALDAIDKDTEMYFKVIEELNKRTGNYNERVVEARRLSNFYRGELKVAETQRMVEGIGRKFLEALGN